MQYTYVNVANNRREVYIINTLIFQYHQW